MASIQFSVIIPAFNRAWCIQRALKSAFEFAASLDLTEIILVDDGSTDNTCDKAEEYISSISGGGPKVKFKVLRSPSNTGVCAAKNRGAIAASGDWLVFLDSDDELLTSGIELQTAIQATNSASMHFFPSISESQSHVPTDHDISRFVKPQEYIKGIDIGESLPVIRRQDFLLSPYDEDMPGYESLSYMRIASRTGILAIHELKARRYYTSHDSRLSSRTGMQARSLRLAKGHLRALRENYAMMSPLTRIKYFARYVKAVINARF